MVTSILKRYQGLLVLSWVYGLSFFSTLFMIMTAGRFAYELGFITLATLPMGMQYSGIMCGTIPVSKILMRFGVRQGFIIMQIVGLVASCILVISVLLQSFALLLMASFVMGVFISGQHQIRYMASDTVVANQRALAVSTILASSIVGGLFASSIANGADFLTNTPFLGIYITHFVMILFGFIALLMFDIPVNKISIKDYKLDFSLLKRTGVKPAIVIIALGYSSMTFLMTAVPIVMSKMGIDIFTSNKAIGYHALGMALPSLCVGYFIAKTSTHTIVFIGAVLYSTMIFIHLLLEPSIFTLTLGLVLLGIGWCCIFVSGSTMITEILPTSERIKIQGFVDFCVFGLTAIAGLSTGIALYFIGWVGANIVVAIATGIILIMACILYKK